jgi:hypothetical protein
MINFPPKIKNITEMMTTDFLEDTKIELIPTKDYEYLLAEHQISLLSRTTQATGMILANKSVKLREGDFWGSASSYDFPYIEESLAEMENFQIAQTEKDELRLYCLMEPTVRDYFINHAQNVKEAWQNIGINIRIGKLIMIEKYALQALSEIVADGAISDFHIYRSLHIDSVTINHLANLKLIYETTDLEIAFYFMKRYLPAIDILKSKLERKEKLTIAETYLFKTYKNHQIIYKNNNPKLRYKLAFGVAEYAHQGLVNYS